MDEKNIDKIIKDKIDKGNQAPKEIRKFIDSTLNSLPEKKSYNYKKIASIAALLCLSITVFGVVMPTYAENFPYIGSLFEKLNFDSNYKTYGTELNIQYESKGTKVTIKEVVYDGYQLSIGFVIESENKILSEPEFTAIKINNKEINSAHSYRGEFTNDNKTFIGAVTYNFFARNLENYSSSRIEGEYLDAIPDSFDLNIEIDKLALGVTGKWDFDIPITNVSATNEMKIIPVKEYSGHIFVEEIAISPLNIYVKTSCTEGCENTFDQHNIIVMDNKGRELVNVDRSGYNIDNIDYQQGVYENKYDDIDEIKVISYEKESNYTTVDGNGNMLKEGTMDDVIVKKLNIDEPTIVELGNGDELTVTRVEIKDGVTNIYYKSKYPLSLDLALGTIREGSREDFVDNIFKYDEFDTPTIATNGVEVVRTLTHEIERNKDYYLVVGLDYKININEEDSISVKIK